MLEVKDLSVYYGVIQALKGISFEVNEGDVIALIGANGAGKTTTLHTITGLFHLNRAVSRSRGKTLQRYRAISWCRWGLPMCRRGGVYLHSSPFCRT